MSTSALESETSKMFIAAIDFYISSSKPWEVDSLTQLLETDAFTAKEKRELSGRLENAKREYRAELLREQLAKILVGEDMVKGAKDHVQRMGAPKPPVLVPQHAGSNLPQLTARDIEELMHKQNEYAKQDYMRNATQALGSSCWPAIQAAKDPWKNTF